eukprot:2952428-Amphidinium_carterae.1
MDDRLYHIFTQPNYGRGVPVVMCGSELSVPTINLLAHHVQTFDREALHKHNMSVLQQLDDTTLGQSYQEHISKSADFLKLISEVAEGTQGGTSAGVPILEPQIVCQTAERVGVTLTPGPNATSKEFLEVDLVLVDQRAERQHVPAIMLEEGTVVSPMRIRGIAVENPLKQQRALARQSMDEGAQGGTSAGAPINQGGVEVYVDYLNNKGIESEGAIRYPTRDWYREYFLVSSSYEFTQVAKQSMQAEGVDYINRRLNRVEGLWILNGCTWLVNKRERHVKLLEVGPEGRPRRASLVRKADPDRFRHPKWNGSPECLTINWYEYYEQFLYTSKEGNFQQLTQAEVDEYNLGRIHLASRPEPAECSAIGRHCVPCGGGFGEIFPCMLCENWAHMGCSYGVEGGRVCASHVAVLDAAQGLAVIVSDPSGRLEGTILRPTAIFGKATSKPKKSRVGNNWESRNTEGQRFWEMIAMYKPIWLAAGLAYDHGQEATGVEMVKNDRGFVERITPFGTMPCLPAGTPFQRMSRALLLETTAAYLSHNIPGDRSVFRRWKFRHVVHQYRRVQQTAITTLLARLPTLSQSITATELFSDEWTRGLSFLKNIPLSYEKTPFVQLTYASDVDRALEYQPLVVRELARKAFIWDNRQVPPTPTYMQDLVTHDPNDAYCRDTGWPWVALTIAYVTEAQYDFLLNQTILDAEMHPTTEEETVVSTDEEILFANEEEDRSMRDSCAAARIAMEVDEGSCGGTSAHDPKGQEDVKTLPEPQVPGAQGGTSAGAPTQLAASGVAVDNPSISLEKNESYVRKITLQTFEFIKKQEEVLSEWTKALSCLDEDTEAYKSMLGQIALVRRMVDHYESALQAAHVYAPAPPPPSGS